ncbi:hypothetical protein OMP38_00055 [Cohnella ginsengisoli]|uniref:Uncharacterized protein n=1 Tax=Cohnella ginsengisoli TaxID=425004 RepID=A0A9X4KCF6_9BACL|nr:hypothetical protein [Cohnella ginsengisoli]MDG0789417.1 hypothetical protein [Cohnella ginsengisoli]
MRIQASAPPDSFTRRKPNSRESRLCRGSDHHSYNTFATEFPDGRITTSTTNDLFSPDHDYKTESGNRDKLGKVLTEDVAFALDQFELIQSGQIPSDLKGRIDLGHVGTFGHFIGGATAYDAS